MASVDRETNNVSLLNVTEMLTVALPAGRDRASALEAGVLIPETFELMSLWARQARDPGETVRVRLLLETPDGKRERFGGAPEVIDLRKHPRVRHRVSVKDLVFHQAGVHWFLIQTPTKRGGRWRTVAAVPLELQLGASESA